VSYTAPPSPPPAATWSGPWYGYGGAWSAATVNPYLASANLTYDTSEWFYNPYTDEIQALVMKKAGGGSFNSAQTAPLYSALQAQFPTLGQTGGQIDYNNAILSTIAASVESISLLSPTIMSEGMATTLSAWQAQQTGATARRDGYFIAPDGLTEVSSRPLPRPAPPRPAPPRPAPPRPNASRELTPRRSSTSSTSSPSAPRTASRTTSSSGSWTRRARSCSSR